MILNLKYIESSSGYKNCDGNDMLEIIEDLSDKNQFEIFYGKVDMKPITSTL